MDTHCAHLPWAVDKRDDWSKNSHHDHLVVMATDWDFVKFSRRHPVGELLVSSMLILRVTASMRLSVRKEGKLT